MKRKGRELLPLLAQSEKAIREGYGPDAMNIGVNLGASAGAGVVGHLHFHMVPRWNGDTNFMTVVSETRVVSEDLDQSFKKLSPYFSDQD